MMRLILIILLITFQNVISQNKSFKWNDETCRYLSIFDSTKYGENEIVNCYSITYSGGFRLTKSPWVFKVSDIDKLNKSELTDEYLTKLEKAKNLLLPKNGKWNEYRDNIITELNQTYKLHLISYKAYQTKDFTILNEFWESDDLLEQYSNGLQGTDDELLNSWKKLTSEKANKNCCPKKVWSKYQKMKGSDNWKELAQVDIMTFGWRNAANKYIQRFDGWKHYNEFSELFISTKEIDCDGI